MKKASFISVFTLAGSLTVAAPGVHLAANDMFAFGFNGVQTCRFYEFVPPGGYAMVYFVDDLLDPGESLRPEMFENQIDANPLAARTFNPNTASTSASLSSVGAWFDFKGVIRLSVLNGLIDIVQGDFGVAPSVNSIWSSTVVLPEPATWGHISSAALFFVVPRKIHALAGCAPSDRVVGRALRPRTMRSIAVPCLSMLHAEGLGERCPAIMETVPTRVEQSWNASGASLPLWR